MPDPIEPDLIVEPSCDIHVVLDSAVPRPRLTVYFREFAPFGTPNTLTPITAYCEFDFFVPGSNTVPVTRFASIAANGDITPHAVGTNLVQVRLEQATTNHYIILRIQVHERLDGWWFGDDTLPVVRHDSIAHSKVSIYALFDFDAAHPERAIVGDITGHGYVALTSANEAIAELDADGRGRVKGKTVGNTQITGTLLGRSQDLKVEVVDVYNTTRVAKRVRGSGPAEDRLATGDGGALFHP